MKKSTHLITLAMIAIVVLNVSPIFAGQVFHPVDTLELEIIPPESIADINETFWLDITQKIEEKITAASIKLPQKRPALTRKQSPYDKLTIHIDILKIGKQDKLVFHSAAFFSKKLPDNQVDQRIILWKNQGELKITEIKTARTKMEDAILSQVEIFLKVCIASPAVITPKDASSEAVDAKYVSSKNSKIFHKIDCSSAKRIKSANKISYKNRVQAIEDAKRPCKRCKP